MAFLSSGRLRAAAPPKPGLRATLSHAPGAVKRAVRRAAPGVGLPCREACSSCSPSRGDGFASGLLVGAALGFVYTPCAGPILAAVIAVSAATGRTVAVAVAYAIGSAAVLLGLSLGG